MVLLVERRLRVGIEKGVHQGAGALTFLEGVKRSSIAWDSDTIENESTRPDRAAAPGVEAKIRARRKLIRLSAMTGIEQANRSSVILINHKDPPCTRRFLSS